MSFGENLQYLRKASNLTQESLAEKMEVSRQTVSKWESGSAFPEMDKLMQMCGMFGCTMDSLMMGSVERDMASDTLGYDRAHRDFNWGIVSGVFLILFGVTFMMALLGISRFGISDGLAGAVFFAFLIVAVGIFIVAGMKYDNFEKKHPYVTPFYTDAQKDAFKNRFIIMIAAPTVAILIGVLIVIVFGEILERPAALDQESWETIAAAIFMLIVTVSASVYTYAGMEYSKYDVEGYNRRNNPDEETKRKNALISKCTGSIMLTATLIYVVAGLGWDLWSSAWIAFPAGGILCAIAALVLSKNEDA